MHLSPTLESGDPPHNTIGYDEEFLHYKVHEIVSNVLYFFFQILYNRGIESEVGLLKKMFVTPPAIFFLYKKRFYLHSTMKS